MTASDPDDIERTIIQLKGGVDCLRAVAAATMHDDAEAAAALRWIANNLERDIDTVYGYYEAAPSAKGNGPRAVS